MKWSMMFMTGPLEVPEDLSRFSEDSLKTRCLGAAGCPQVVNPE